MFRPSDDSTPSTSQRINDILTTGKGIPEVVHPPASEPQSPTLAAYAQHKKLQYTDVYAPSGFSAVDIEVYVHPQVPDMTPEKFGTLSLLTVSTHRDKFPVSSLSRVGPKGFTYGHRMIAGTLAFNTVNADAFRDYCERNRIMAGYSARWNFRLHPDDIPLFDINIIMANEAGEMSACMLKGVTILDSGSSYSLENVTLSETYSYMALDRTPLEPLSVRKFAPDLGEPAPTLCDVPPEGSYRFSRGTGGNYIG